MIVKNNGYLSKSKIQCYWTCPYKYKLIYIQDKRVETPAMTRGIELHKIFENVYCDLFKMRDIDFDKAIEPYWKEEYKNDLKNFLDFNWWIYNSVENKKDALPIAVEKHISIDEEKLHGIIDAVWKTKKSVLLLDFKTGVGNNFSVDHYLFDLCFYKNLWDRHFSKITHWGLYFTKNDFYWKERADENKVQNALQKVKLTRKLIDAKEFNKVEDFSICKSCELYKKYCNGCR
ncbi:MAG: PD-(D/E)XK nuclease family protein [Candidatus Heimdallarchaeaceae archaeon]